MFPNYDKHVSIIPYIYQASLSPNFMKYTLSLGRNALQVNQLIVFFLNQSENLQLTKDLQGNERSIIKLAPRRFTIKKKLNRLSVLEKYKQFAIFFSTFWYTIGNLFAGCKVPYFFNGPWVKVMVPPFKEVFRHHGLQAQQA